MDAIILEEQAMARYADATEREEALRRCWVELGQPITVMGRFGVVAVHPLLQEIRQSEAHAARLGRRLVEEVKRPVGRPQGAASAPDRNAGRPGILRSVREPELAPGTGSTVTFD